MSHFLLMVIHAAVIAVFFALLSRHDTRERIKLFAQIFFAMLAIALVLAWLMYPFPSGPPTASP